MKARRYIMNYIHDCMKPGPNFAIDLVDSIEKKFGVKYTPQRIGAHLHIMHENKEVKMEREIVRACVKRNKWFIMDGMISL